MRLKSTKYSLVKLCNWKRFTQSPTFYISIFFFFSFAICFVFSRFYHFASVFLPTYCCKTQWLYVYVVREKLFSYFILQWHTRVYATHMHVIETINCNKPCVLRAMCTLHRHTMNVLETLYAVNRMCILCMGICFVWVYFLWHLASV